ncbi:MAG: hypothetical protein Q9190_006517 [Brigantiaea leucoxantha]
MTEEQLAESSAISISNDMASADQYPSQPSAPRIADPILRNALRYTISEKEYKALHEYLISRAPPALRKRAIPPSRVTSFVKANDEFNAAAVRASLRVFIASQTGLKIWALITTYIAERGRSQKCNVTLHLAAREADVVG